MSDTRFYRIKVDDLEEMRERLRHVNAFPKSDYVEAAAAWIQELPELDRALRILESAFACVRLGNGIGLSEAQGIDDYASNEELANLRRQDEKEDWRRISHDELNRSYSSPTFMDAEGFVFHLPAFVIAELNDKYHYGFVEQLINSLNYPEGWTELLNESQRNALADVLSITSRHPEHKERIAMFTNAIEHLRTQRKSC